MRKSDRFGIVSYETPVPSNEPTAVALSLYDVILK